MSRTRQTAALVIAVLTCVAMSAGADPAPPGGVSPGSATAVVTVNGSCPTFSWAADPGDGFELTVLTDSGNQALLVNLPAGALSWTPAPEQCLQPGGVYGWAIRSVSGPSSGAWSRPLLFRVSLAPTPEEVASAIEILRASGAQLPPPGRTEPALNAVEGARPIAPATPPAKVTPELEGDAGMSVDGIVEVHGLLSQSADAGASDNIVADGQISTPLTTLEVPLLYLNSGGQLSTATYFHSPAPGELEIGRGTGSDPDAEVVVDLLIVNSLSTDVLKSSGSGWIGGGGAGVDGVPLNGSNQIRLDSAGDECPAGSVATGIRLKVVDTNQAGVELECSG